MARFSTQKLYQFDMKYVGAGTGPGPVRTGPDQSLTGPKIRTGPADRAISAKASTSFLGVLCQLTRTNMRSENILILDDVRVKSRASRKLLFVKMF